MKITQKDLDKWETGFYAANPEQCKLLVKMLRREQELASASKAAMLHEAEHIKAAIKLFCHTEFLNETLSAQVAKALAMLATEHK